MLILTDSTGSCSTGSTELAQLAQLAHLNLLNLVDIHRNWLNFLILEGGHYSDRLHDYFVTIPRCFFPHTTKLWNSLSIECFPLPYDLNGFKSKINRHLSSVSSF